MRWSPPPPDSEIELRERAPESVWLDAMRRIAERHDLDASAPRPFASGSDIVWGLGEAVVKLTEPGWRWQIEAEAHWLRAVAGRTRLACPSVLAEGELSGWPYVVTSRLAGRAVAEVWPALAAAERRRLAHELGGHVRELQAVRAQPPPTARPWPVFWAECRANAQDRHARGGAPAGLVAELPTFLASVGELVPPGSETGCLLHTELLDQHLFVEGVAAAPTTAAGASPEPSSAPLRWSGVIDFADARLGPPEYDVPGLVEFLMRGERGLLRAFLTGYGYADAELTPGLARRLCAFGLQHRYGSLRRMLDAVGPPMPRSLDELAQRLYGVAN